MDVAAPALAARARAASTIVSNLLGLCAAGRAAGAGAGALARSRRGWRCATPPCWPPCLSYALEVGQKPAAAACAVAAGLAAQHARVRRSARCSVCGWRAPMRWAGCSARASRGSRSAAAAGLLCCCYGRSHCCFLRRSRSALSQVWERVRDALRDAFGGAAAEPLARWLEAGPLPTARLSPVAELLAVACGLLGPCLMTYSMARPGLRRVWLVLGATAFAFGVTDVVGGVELRSATRVGLVHGQQPGRARAGLHRWHCCCLAVVGVLPRASRWWSSPPALAWWRRRRRIPTSRPACTVGTGTLHPLSRSGAMDRMVLAVCGDVVVAAPERRTGMKLRRRMRLPTMRVGPAVPARFGSRT